MISELVYAVIRYCAGTDYEKTMILDNGRLGEIPSFRLNSNQPITASIRHEKVTAMINKAVTQEFSGVLVKRLRLFKRYDRVRIYLIELNGWPEPREGHHLYFFADKFRIQSMPSKTRHIINLVDKKLELLLAVAENSSL